MVNEKRLSNTEAVIRKLRNANCAECNVVRKVQCSACWVDDVVSLLEDAPTVDAVEVVHGRWEPIRYGNLRIATCSACGWKHGLYINGNIPNYYYCPSCGAKMDGGNDDG